jgi:hypothetical protein
VTRNHPNPYFPSRLTKAEDHETFTGDPDGQAPD